MTKATSTEDYAAVLRAAVGDEATFLRLIVSKPLVKRPPWVKVTVRPVAIKGERRLQFSFFDGRHDTSRNLGRRAAAKQLDELLDAPFGQYHLQATTGDIHVRISRRGKVTVRRTKASRPAETPDLSHDRTKQHPLPADARDPLLLELGVVGRQGKVHTGMRGKFTQINEFLRVIEQVALAEKGDGGDFCGAGPRSDKDLRCAEMTPVPFSIIDCGCGSAALTFAAYHFLHHTQGRAVRVEGVDVNPQLVRKSERLRRSLGWDGLAFHVGRIIDHEPAERPDLVLSLHACDTATDEALASGLRWGARTILAAPCCQHELHDQLASEPLRGVLRQGILRERLADVVTDAFRALALRIVGYRTSVVEFVSPESTAKNLLIRAEWGIRPGRPDAVAEYLDLKRFWGVTPAIEGMMGEALTRHLTIELG
jgi:hypothetical protein